jgi:ABC-type glycerol-3-phosphate transport system permease component
MLSTVLVYLCTELKCFLQGGNSFYRIAIPLYRAGMLSAGLECFLQGWNAFDSVSIPLYRVGMLSRGMECSRQSWKTFVQSWNSF